MPSTPKKTLLAHDSLASDSGAVELAKPNEQSKGVAVDIPKKLVEGDGGKRHAVRPAVVVLSLVAALGGLVFGYDIGGSGGTFVMDGFREQMGWPAEGSTPAVVQQQSLITAMFSVGAICGSMPSGYLADRFGRRMALQLAALTFTIGALIQTVSFGMAQLLVGRFIGGIGVGLLSMMVCLYQAECAPAHLRGLLCTLQQLCITAGILLAALVNVPLALTTWGWRLSYGGNGIFSLIQLVSLFFLPESPRWLVKASRDADARAALARIRQPEEIEAELEAVKHEVEAERALGEGSWGDLFKEDFSMRFRTTVGLLIQFLQQFTGINVVMFFAPVIFNTFLTPTAALWSNVVVMAVNFFCTFIAVRLVDSAGRRKLLLLGGTLQAFACLAIAVMASPLFDYTTNEALGFAIVAFIALYVLNFAYAWGPIPWVYCAEIFPLQLRGKAMSATTFCNWSCNFIIGLVSPYLMQPSALDIWGTFIFFGSCCVVMTAWVYLYLPETSQKSLEEMDDVFLQFKSKKNTTGSQGKGKATAGF